MCTEKMNDVRIVKYISKQGKIMHRAFVNSRKLSPTRTLRSSQTNAEIHLGVYKGRHHKNDKINIIVLDTTK